MNIKTTRKRVKLTQQELADLVGLEPTYLSRIEVGTKPAPFWLPLVIEYLQRKPVTGRKLITHAWPENGAPRWFNVLMEITFNDDKTQERLVDLCAISDQEPAGEKCLADVD